MQNKTQLLFEIGCEELPALEIVATCKAIESRLTQSFKDQHYAHGAMHVFGTPRRLAILVDALHCLPEERQEERRGPSVEMAWNDQGEPSKAALGFARSCGVEIDDLERMVTNKGEWLLFRQTVAGKPINEMIGEIVTKAVKNLPFRKTMRWGAGNEEFVRPVHWVVLMLGNESIVTPLLGVESGRVTYGHRFHHPEAIPLLSASGYEATLEQQGYVIASVEKRKQAIVSQLTDLNKTENFSVQIDQQLLEEIVGLVEWPVVIKGAFDARFLEIPREVLIESMKKHQKYFCVFDDQQELMNAFVTVANIESSNPEEIRKGNEKVIRPRLDDAAFFWKEDGKKTLFECREKLKSIVFQAKLGSLFDKTERLVKILRVVNEKGQCPQELVDRSAQLCKSDLVTHMVNEFASLQGVMGKYYAQINGESETVATAISEYYKPTYSGGDLPSTEVACLLSVADKIDTLVGIYGIGMKPSGDKDPYALKRSTAGIIRILVEKKMDINLSKLIDTAVDVYLQTNVDLADEKDNLLQFVNDRIRNYLVEQGKRKDLIEAVMTVDSTRPFDVVERLESLQQFAEIEQAATLVAANKRINNLLKKFTPTTGFTLLEQDLSTPQEKKLLKVSLELESTLTTLMESGNHLASLEALLVLCQPVDEFFEHVMIMVDDERVKNIRIHLLNQVKQQFSRVADLSKLAG